MEKIERQRRNSSSSSSSTSSVSSVSRESTTSRAREARFNSDLNRKNSYSDSYTGRASYNRNRRDASDSYAGRSRLVTENQEPKDGEEANLPAALVGTCPHMCPASERGQRERLRDLAVFERLHGDPRKTSPELAVKKFCRTITIKDVRASDVRPLPVLEDTLNYLLNLLDSSEQSFAVIHDFIFDRTRSIRQDLSMQNIVNDKAIHMYEEMVKFHVISHHKLRTCNGSTDSSSLHYLNLEQLTKALTTLLNLYEANRNPKSLYQNEAEFHSLFVLLHLDTTNQPMGESLNIWFRNVSSPILISKEMSFARKILRFFRLCNYRRFFCTIKAEASYLQYCILEPYINEVRALAVSCINSAGYKLHPYPLAHLSKLLMMKESDAESFCNNSGLKTCIDEAGIKLLPTKQTTFCLPKGRVQNYSFVGFD